LLGFSGICGELWAIPNAPRPQEKPLSYSFKTERFRKGLFDDLIAARRNKIEAMRARVSSPE
jgi:hypothetical protein